MKKRLCSFMLFLCLLAASLGTFPKDADAKKTAEQITYAAFGDSIAAGYGLSEYSEDQTAAPADSYQGLLGDFLHTEPCNYAVSGDNSSDCIQLLNSGAADADLKKADVISLSIGSNDLLLPFIEIVMDYFGIDPDTIDGSDFTNGFDLSQIDPAEMLNYYQQAQELLAILSDHPELHAQADAFSEKLQTILSILHAKAPAAEIYVANIYNPFYFVPALGELAEVYITEINQAFSADASDYTLVDVHTPFNKKELTNVHFDLNDPGSINPDPHPSAQGHKKIANLFIQALKNAHAPKAAVLKSTASSRRYKLTAKMKIPADADGCQIRYAASKNGTYKTLARTSKKTYRTNSGRLKAGKKYFVKVRSYKKIKGVVYYGKNSSVKKIKIAAK